MHFKVDPTYLDTARMAAEGALCLVEERASADGLKSRSYANCGVVTPAIAIGDALLPRLTRREGTTFELKEL